MRAGVASALAVLLLVALPGEAPAQSVSCGIDCGSGTYTSCIDDVSLTGAPVNLNCSASLGSCQGEIFCATLGQGLPSTAFPLFIEEIILVAAGNTPVSVAEPFDLLVFEETGVPIPGAQLGPTYNLSISGSQTAATRIDLTQGGFQPIQVPNAGTFRVCLRKQFDGGHNVCLDSNGTSAPGRNWAFVSVGSPTNPCGITIFPSAWYAADGTGSIFPGFPGLIGDFILRAKIRPASLGGVPGAQGCGPGTDAGVPDATGLDAGAADGGASDAASGLDAGEVRDAAGVPDASNPDGGAAPGDMGITEDAAAQDAESSDGAPRDAETPGDGGPADGGAGIADGGTPPGDAGVGPHPAPEIFEVSPRQGQSGVPTPITVTGRSFDAEATARLDQIPLVDVSVAGGSTLRATVPAGVADGTYDLVVTNPDGQAVVRADAFTVGAAPRAPPAGGSPVAEDGCTCTRRAAWPSASLALALACLFILPLRSRRRPMRATPRI